ncbi:TraB/GumN family protein [Pontibacter sp. JH31]|uniref:TraB/GumN family protein n=1 Tax=Pontibacter aquaedesilientis TaxID=2766980 RepID=A0ABR7XJA8_9BACT|nr:TraB/GumN family protein [Pontibacter aquaedesilientis]MBD1398384.1 TraB/GumN family protein [Pontibacter aquaedesilientis]
MKHENKLSLLYLFLFVLLLIPVAGEAQKVKTKPAQATAKSHPTVLAKSLLWEISGKDLKAPSYLYGTFHLLNQSYLNSEPEVLEHFTKARAVVVETEIDSAKMMQLGAKMVMPDNKLSALLSKEDFALVSNEVKQSFGFDLAMADQMKPMTILLMLSMSQYQNMEVLKQYKGQPLDVYFANSGHKDGKKIHRLETMEQQFDLLYDHHTVEKQAEHLVAYVKHKEPAEQISERLTQLYFDKDLAGMWTISEEYNELTGGGDMAYMVDDRNKAWMTKLPAIMKAQSTFIAVGALHLPGENGLLQLLQKAGYTVKPLQ